MEKDPVFSEFAPEFQDFRERCERCNYRIDASALALLRSNPSDFPILANATDGSTLVGGSALEFAYHVGPRLSFVITDCAGWGFEANFFALDGWSSAHDFSNAVLPGGVANLIVDSVITEPMLNTHIDIASMLYSSELNVRKNLCNNLDVISGFRWIDMFDRYFASGTSAVTGNALREQVETRNHLFGGQIGLDGRIGSPSGCMQIGGFIKGGCALNDAHATTKLSDPGNLGDLSVTDDEVHASFFGEAGLTGYYQLDKHVSVSMGYQVMYLTSTAQPLNQLGQTDLVGGTTLVELGSGVFYHGANLGMEVNW
jgi:hypothetical protein